MESDARERVTQFEELAGEQRIVLDVGGSSLIGLSQEFETLTDAGKLGFAHAPGVDLGRLLPMLAAPSDVLVVLEGLLQYSPSRRSSAAQILRRDQWQQALNNPESSIVMAGFKYQGIKEGL